MSSTPALNKIIKENKIEIEILMETWQTTDILKRP
jgi:hypothetical protein